MPRRVASFLALSALALGASTLVSRDAEACGGCFVPASENTVVTGHRMALSISMTRTVLWDQIQYTGDPAEFSWVLPVKGAAYIEVANDAFFDVLDSGTLTTVQAPPEGCVPPSNGGGFGCGDSALSASRDSFGGESSGGGVQVLHQGTIGPYETVTLSATNPNALREWLADNGYDVPESIEPTIDAYVEEEFDFIALKLQPDSGIAQMKPVRVITPGSSYTLPLRMVAAGVGESVQIVLFVIGEGRYEATDFANVRIEPKLVTWDFKVDRSDYAELRLASLATGDRRNWLTTYSKKNAVLGQVNDSLGTVTYTIGDNFQFADTLAGAYFLQGIENAEGTGDATTCLNELQGIPGGGVVTDLCDDQGTCRAPESGEIDSRRLACNELDDIAVALEGMHPNDVSVTRLEADLPVAALDADLLMQASNDQGDVDARFAAGLKVNACWDQPSATPLTTDRRWQLPPSGLVLFGLGAAGLLYAMRRRRVTSPA